MMEVYNPVRTRFIEDLCKNAKEIGKITFVVVGDLFNARTRNALYRANWYNVTLAELDAMSDEDLLKVRLLGVANLAEIRNVIKEIKEVNGITGTLSE